MKPHALNVGIMDDALVYIEIMDGGLAVARSLLEPDEARELAAALLAKADELDKA